MSYYATFKPTQEAIDQVKEKDPLPWSRGENDLQEYESELLVLAMRNPENLNIKSAMFQIKCYLSLIKNQAIHDCIQHAVSQFEQDGDLYWCGWDKAERECSWDEESVTKSLLEDLIMYTFIVPTKDYYNHEEHEDFYEKLNTVTERIKGYYESIYDWYIFEIMEQLVDYRTGEDLGKGSWWLENSKVKQEIEEENDEADSGN